MLIDLGQGGPQTFQADVAVIGAGAAGLTLTRRLLEHGRSVLLIESGGFDHEPAAADLNRGETAGQPYYDLADTRLRFFGGTTAIWGGRAAEMDPIDFERRDWVPWSGWPIRHSDIAPYYREARALLDLPQEDPATSASLLGQLDPSQLSVRHWLIDLQFDRFGRRRNADLLAHPRLTLLLHATVTNIELAANGRAVDRLDVQGPGGSVHGVNANEYVLAAGGFENPRLLLASNSVQKAGIGNDRDLVGRFFMEHPHGRGGRLRGGPAWKLLRAFQKRRLGHQETAALLAPSPELQAERRILNSAVTIAVRPPASGSQPLLTATYLAAKHRFEPTERGRAFWKGYKTLGRYLRQGLGPVYAWGRHRFRSDELVLVLRGEQAPNPDSRVSLIPDQRDASGVPRVKLDWQLLPQDRESVATLVDILASETARLGLGKIEPARWLADESANWVSDPLVSVHPLGGYHHMGTTRMADNRSRGVADGWGRLHGVSNLHITGSSLFPTGGWANPTLTILALALRTADRIAGKA